MISTEELSGVDNFISNFPGGINCSLCFGDINSSGIRTCFKTPRLCRNRIFLSFKFTGENINDLDIFLKIASAALVDNSNAVFCSLWLESLFQIKKMNAEQIYEFCLERLTHSDIFLAFIWKEEESRGMLLELDEAIKRGKRIILFIKKGLQGHQKFRNLSDDVNEYSDEIDLIQQLQSI